jgi:hypothetical protein
VIILKLDLPEQSYLAFVGSRVPASTDTYRVDTKQQRELF